MVLVYSSCVVLLIVCVAVAVGDQPAEEGRSLRDYASQDWKAMDRFSLSADTSDWIPHQPEVPRRRRIRKRKRRPPLIDLLEDQTPEESATVRKRLRPQRLDQIKEPWEDMSDEIATRSYNRRRLTPVFEEPEVKTVEKIRDPFTALQEEEEKQRRKNEETTGVPDLKTLLKQSGGLSLSEVLQQKNLSLAELLQGDQQAISILASEATTETTSSKPNTYRRYLPSVQAKTDSVKQDEQLSPREKVEAQRKRLVLLNGNKDSKLFSEVTKYDVVTEETTEKRIFVPANSKFYTSVDYRPNIIFRDITTTPLSTTTDHVSPVSFKSRTKELPVTTAKLKKIQNSEAAPKAETIDINEILGFHLLDKKNSSEDGPLKMSIDLEEIPTTETVKEEKVKTLLPTQIVEGIEITTTMSVGEKLKHVTAKEEIMEILNNPYDREELSKILERRNMTVDELIALRERGSSQLHLADIFHNKTREPEPEGEPFIGHINAVDLNTFPFFNRKSKNIAIPTSPIPITKSSSVLEKQLVTTNPPYTITSFPTYKIETNKNFKPPPFFPAWKSLHPSFLTDVFDNSLYEDRTKATTSTSTEKIIYDLDSLEEIENTLTEAANRKLHFNPNIYNDEVIGLPPGVKSAIFASLAIVGLSLLVFLTILVVFKWTQKQKRRLTYTGSFSGSKIKSPILEPDQRRTFKTFMTETLGKKKNYYKSHLQNVSDDFWDTQSEKKAYMM